MKLGGGKDFLHQYANLEGKGFSEHEMNE